LRLLDHSARPRADRPLRRTAEPRRDPGRGRRSTRPRGGRSAASRHRPDLPAVRSRASAPGDRSPRDDRQDPADPMNARTATQATAPNLVPLAATLLAGAIAALLDSTITTMALDELSRELTVPVTTIQWVTTAYVLAMTAVIPLVGWSVGRFGA